MLWIGMSVWALKPLKHLRFFLPFEMKGFVLSIFIFGTALAAQSQIIFRNDFVIGPHHKVKNKGLTFITINLDRYPNLNMLVNGRGGRSLVIDVQALRQPDKVYMYSELAEKIYTPGPVFRPSVAPVPTFLLLPPPFSLKRRVYRSFRNDQ